MTSTRRKSRHAGAVGAAVLGLAVVAAVAVAAVTVYKNDLSGRGEFRELRAAGAGERCEREYGERNELMRVTAERGPDVCSYTVPVRGDAPAPDHALEVEGRILGETDGSIRGSAFISLSVRKGRGQRYQVRVFPRPGRVELRRLPDGGGFPVEKRSDAVNGIGKRNVILLQAFGDRIRVLVNGERVAAVTDPRPGQVGGRALDFGIGNEESTRENVVGTIDEIRVAVPDGG